MKILYNTITNSIHPYPRIDDEPVIGLSSEFQIFDVLQDPEPVPQSGYFYTKSDPVIDTANKVVTYGWTLNIIPSEPEPDYVKFLNDVIASQVYQKAIMQAMSSPIVNVGFTTTMGALILAAGGNPNQEGIKSAFNLMLNGMSLIQQDIDELQSIVNSNNMSNFVDLPVL